MEYINSHTLNEKAMRANAKQKIKIYGAYGALESVRVLGRPKQSLE